MNVKINSLLVGDVVAWGLSVLSTGTGASLSSHLGWDFYTDMKASGIEQVSNGRRYCEYTYLGCLEVFYVFPSFSLMNWCNANVRTYYVRSKVCRLGIWPADQAPGTYWHLI